MILRKPRSVIPYCAALCALGVQCGQCSSGKGKNSRFPADRRKNTKCCCRQLAITHYFPWNMFLWFDFWVIPFWRRAEGVLGWQDVCLVWGSQHTARLHTSLLASVPGLSLACGSWITCFKGYFINPTQQVSKTRFKYNRGLFWFGFILIVFSLYL